MRFGKRRRKRQAGRVLRCTYLGGPIPPLFFYVLSNSPPSPSST